jgi:uncharacterized membrane protein YgcG
MIVVNIIAIVLAVGALSLCAFSARTLRRNRETLAIVQRQNAERAARLQRIPVEDGPAPSSQAGIAGLAQGGVVHPRHPDGRFIGKSTPPKSVTPEPDRATPYVPPVDPFNGSYNPPEPASPAPAPEPACDPPAPAHDFSSPTDSNGTTWSDGGSSSYSDGGSSSSDGGGGGGCD